MEGEEWDEQYFFCYPMLHPYQGVDLLAIIK